jgi:hypothetical protein
LTALSSKRSEGRAVFEVSNPYAQAIPLLAVRGKVRVNGQEVGAGAGNKRKLRAGKKARLELPFRVDRDRFLAAAGEKWAVGASVDAEVEGTVTVSLPSGEAAFPFRFSGKMGTDGAREGVFSHPDGVTSLSPH